MKYIINEILVQDNGSKNAGSKARMDVTNIFNKNGYQILNLEWPILNKRNLFNLFKMQIKSKKIFKSKFCILKNGDTLVIQYPNMRWLFSIGPLMLKLKKRGIKIIVFIHDIPTLRNELNKDSKSVLYNLLMRMENQCFKASYKIISHNGKMTNYLVSRNVARDKIIDLQLFDYLYDKTPNVSPERNSSMIVAGNLSKEKAGFLNAIPDGLYMNLYGVGYSGITNNHVKYYGSFLPEELINHLVGDYGLVWDGGSADGCKGNFGEYMKYNNPHKISLYLASGIPVVIWKQAALADFVVANKLGIVVESLNDLPAIFAGISDEDYMVMKNNAEKIGERLRKGYFTDKVMEEIA